MSFPDVPSAMREPSTNRCVSGSNLTVVPGRIVNVAGARTVTSRMTTYVVSLSPHTVSVVMSPRTYVVAATEGATSSRAPHAAARRTRTSAMLRRAEGGSWGRIWRWLPGRKGPGGTPPRFRRRYITHVPPLSCAITDQGPGPACFPSGCDKFHYAPGSSRLREPRRPRRHLLPDIHCGDRRIAPPSEDRLRGPSQPRRQRVPRDRLSGESESHEHPRHPHLPERSGNPGSGRSRDHHGAGGDCARSGRRVREERGAGARRDHGGFP